MLNIRRIFLTLLLVSGTLSIDDDNSSDYNEKLSLALKTIKPYQLHIQQWNIGTSLQQNFFTCDLCTSFIYLARQIVPNLTRERAVNLVVDVCKLLDLAPRDEICDPIINNYADQFLYILKNKPAQYNGTEICALLASPDCSSAHPEMINWDIELTGEGQNFTGPQNPDSLATTKILQFTDIHLDLNYKEGTSTDCGEGMPVCCRDEFGPPKGNSTPAGKYGHNACAMAVEGWKALLNDAKERVGESPFIMLTGDYTHSAVWQYSVAENSRHIRYVSESITDILGDTTKAIYPVVGNHEPHVVNLYAPTDVWADHKDFSLEWMYEATIEPILAKFPNMLPPEEVQRFKRYGYYEASPMEGLRIIVLNTNLPYIENYWLGFKANDPEGQLKWVVGALERAEQQNENVLIVGHIEPGSTWVYWSSIWNRIIERYRGIIRAQFYGHAHAPHFRVTFQNATTNPISLSYVGGSALPDRMNPAYSIYEFDGARGGDSTWTVLNQHLVIMGLNESNAELKPVMRTIDLKKDLEIKDLHPAGVWDWLNKLVCNQTRVDKFLEYHRKGKDSPRYKECKVDDSVCMGDLLCGLVDTNSNDKLACTELRNLVSRTKCSKDGDDGNGGNAAGRMVVSWSLALVGLAITFIFRL